MIQQERAFLKKGAPKLLLICRQTGFNSGVLGAKVFCAAFFQKSGYLLSYE